MNPKTFPIGPLEDAFIDDSFYGPGAMLIDEILEIDAENHFVRAKMPVNADLPITRDQKVHPVLHPRHVSGGLMVHLTGIIAFVHFYYVLGLKHKEGWTGYGARIHEAKYHSLADMSAPLILECKAVKTPRVRSKFLVRYHFEFKQNDKLVYEGDQTAIWMRINLDESENAGEAKNQLAG